jgi:hypothetical protein
MKKHLVAAVLVSAAAAAASVASASVVYDGFDYPVGALEGNTNATAPATTNGYSNANVWTKSGTGTSGPGVVAGSLSYPGLPASVGNSAMLTGAGASGTVTADRVAVPDYHEGDTIYFSMILQVPAGVTNFGTSTTTGSFLTGFQYIPDTIGATTNDLTSGTQTSGAPICVRAAVDGLGYNLGIAYRDAPAGTARVFGATEYTAGQTLFLVGKYEIAAGDGNDVASLFVNPSLGAEPAVADAVSANTAGGHDYFYNANGSGQLESTIRSFILRSNTVEPANMQVDELRIGSSWADVTSVPEPATLSVAGLGAAGLLLRRRGRQRA